MDEQETVKVRAKRIKSQSRLIATVIAIVALAMISIWIVWLGFRSDPTVMEAGENSGSREAEAASTPLAFEGASFESSGVVYVPGANGVLFVDDGKSSGCFWMKLDDSGRQAEPVRFVHIDAQVEDPESITFDGTYFYILGSQSRPDAGARNALIRFRFDPASATTSDIEKIEDLRSFLLKSLPELREAGEQAGTEGGLNIEGIAWDPENRMFLLGLRSPLVERQSPQALLIAIRLKKPDGPFSIENLELTAPQPIRLRLGTLGVRDIHYDTRLKSFLIIAGAPKERDKGHYSLWRWDGSSEEQGLREIAVLDARLKPEGLTRVETAAGDYLLLVYDSSSYSRLDYSSLPEK
ncbi:MAG TPA: DUF3616 domain-containing protein [Blastocatellia bacterium]|nr:DUF3616 domain-containing protein [Blastocatellia bacterium]